MANIYTYYIDLADGHGYIQVFFEKDIILVYEHEDIGVESIFYREKPDSALTLSKARVVDGCNNNETIYIRLLNYYFDSTKHNKELKVKVQRDSVDFWEGWFNVKTCKLFTDSGKFEITAKPDDDYRAIVEGKSKELNILEISTIHDTKVKKNAFMEFYGVSSGGDAPSGDEGWSLWFDQSTLSHPDFPAGYKIFARKRSDLFKVTGEEWIQINDYNDVYYVTSSYSVCCGGINRTDQIDTSDPGTFTECTTINDLVTFYVDPLKYDGDCELIEKTFTQNRDLKDVLQFFVDELCGSSVYTVKSDFFWNDYSVVTRDDAGATTNPYTGTSPNPINWLYIAQKTDYLEYDSPATKGLLKWEELERFLYNMFEVKWYINDSDDLRFEHISNSVFDKTLGVDLTDTGKYDELYTRGTQEYEYDSDDLPIREKWKFMEASHSDFTEDRTIEYDPVQTDSDTEEEYLIERITTDIEMVVSQHDKIDDDGFVMVVRNASDDYISDEAGAYSGVTYVNGHLSVANLQYNYWRDEMVLLSAMWLNDDAVTFDSEKKKRKQKEFKFLYNASDGFNPMTQLIKTPLFKNVTGELVEQTQEGEVLEAKHDLETDMITIKLVYDASNS